MKSYYVHIIRHGNIDESYNKKYIGVTDVPLSEKGIQELKKLDQNYKYPGTSLIYTSPLLRCLRTSIQLYPEIKPNVINGLSECNFGDWENKSTDELYNDPIFKKWIRGEKDVSPPNGENSVDFTSRICGTFENIVNNLMKCGKTQAVIITHGGIISILLSLYGLPRANFSDWNVLPGHGFSLRITPSLWMRDKVLEVYDVIPSK